MRLDFNLLKLIFVLYYYYWCKQTGNLVGMMKCLAAVTCPVSLSSTPTKSEVENDRRVHL